MPETRQTEVNPTVPLHSSVGGYAVALLCRIALPFILFLALAAATCLQGFAGWLRHLLSPRTQHTKQS